MRSVKLSFVCSLVLYAASALAAEEGVYTPPPYQSTGVEEQDVVETTVHTAAPTATPTNSPTTAPTIAPTTAPTSAPTAAPTAATTSAPTTSLTASPTAIQTVVATPFVNAYSPPPQTQEVPTEPSTMAPTESVYTPQPYVKPATNSSSSSSQGKRLRRQE